MKHLHCQQQLRGLRAAANAPSGVMRSTALPDAQHIARVKSADYALKHPTVSFRAGSDLIPATSLPPLRPYPRPTNNGPDFLRPPYDPQDPYGLCTCPSLSNPYHPHRPPTAIQVDYTHTTTTATTITGLPPAYLPSWILLLCHVIHHYPKWPRIIHFPYSCVLHLLWTCGQFKYAFLHPWQVPLWVCVCGCGCMCVCACFSQRLNRSHFSLGFFSICGVELGRLCRELSAKTCTRFS